MSIKTAPDQDIHCGAVIINKLFLMTAASCVCGRLVNCDQQSMGKKKLVDNLNKDGEFKCALYAQSATANVLSASPQALRR